MAEARGPDAGTMHILLHLPTEVLLDEPIRKVTAEAEDGSFCLLPRHVDFVTALVPGVLELVDEGGEEVFVAVDRGVLVKCGRQVRISSFHAVRGRDLERLSNLVQERFEHLDEQERKAQSAFARLEAGALRGFHELQEGSRG